MSKKHPIVAVTGASGAGTSVVQRAFHDIFRREGLNAVFVEGDSFRRYDRQAMQDYIRQMQAKGRTPSPYGPDVNLFDQLESLFRDYSATGRGQMRKYITRETAETLGGEEGTFTPWQETPADSDLLFYEGLHGGVVANHWTRRKMSPSHNPRVIRERRDTEGSSGVDAAQYVDLLLGVVPVVNLEWIQKIHRDQQVKGYSCEASAEHILERMQDYIHFIVPQFSATDINFQRVPLVDTSNPFIARDVPTSSECIVVIRFRDPKRYDFPRLLRLIDGARMSRPNSMVIPGGQMLQAMDVICTPLVHALVENRRQ